MFGDERWSTAGLDGDNEPGGASVVRGLLGAADWLVVAILALIAVVLVDASADDWAPTWWIAVTSATVVGTAQLLVVRRIHPSVVASAIVAALPVCLLAYEAIHGDPESSRAGLVAAQTIWGGLGVASVVVALALCARRRGTDPGDGRLAAPGAAALLAIVVLGEALYYGPGAVDTSEGLEVAVVAAATVAVVVALCSAGDHLRGDRFSAWRALLFAAACGPAIANGWTAPTAATVQRLLFAVAVVAVLLLAAASVVARVRGRRSPRSAPVPLITYLARVP